MECSGSCPLMSCLHSSTCLLPAEVGLPLKYITFGRCGLGLLLCTVQNSVLAKLLQLLILEIFDYADHRRHHHFYSEEGLEEHEQNHVESSLLLLLPLVSTLMLLQLD
ncbi:hypothetical protein RIF29_24128 [Crotalaria pallida]|uniref:Uncharacterized protein n=1 Tax=Crotalaria pallida TaxID=3830 RepID=A0AAN9HW99_CROPI